MTISLGSLGSLTSTQSSPSFRTRLSINQSTSASDTTGSSTDVAYSTRALSSTNNLIDRKVGVLDSQIEETGRLIEIAEQIQGSRYDERSAALRTDASARLSAAIAAYTTAAGNTPSIAEDQQQTVNTNINYDPDSSEDAVIVDISAVSSLEDAGLDEDLFDGSTYSIEETITALENAKSRLESERAALASGSTAVSAGDARAQQKAEVIESSSDTADESDPSEVIKEEAGRVLTENRDSESSISDTLTSLIDDSSSYLDDED